MYLVCIINTDDWKLAQSNYTETEAWLGNELFASLCCVQWGFQQNCQCRFHHMSQWWELKVKVQWYLKAFWYCQGKEFSLNNLCFELPLAVLSWPHFALSILSITYSIIHQQWTPRPWRIGRASMVFLNGGARDNTGVKGTYLTCSWIQLYH